MAIICIIIIFFIILPRPAVMLSLGQSAMPDHRAVYNATRCGLSLFSNLWGFLVASMKAMLTPCIVALLWI